MPMLYTLVAFALRENNIFLDPHSETYQLLVKKAKQNPTHKEDERNINLAVRKMARKLPAKPRYCMHTWLKEEIAFIHRELMDPTIHFSTPL